MKKQYIITILAFLFSASLYSQRERFSVTVNGGESYTMLNNSIPIGLSTEKKGYTVNVQFNAGISHLFSIGIGAGYSNYSSSISLDIYESVKNAVDNEGGIFEYRLYGNKLNEIQSIDFIEIPILFILQNQKHKKFKTYFQLGAKTLLPIESNFECTSGNIVSSGYYSQYNVLLFNMPNHGFDDCSLTGVSGKLLTQVGHAAIMELGANISIGRPYITIAFFGSYGLSSICKQREIFTNELVYQSLSSVASSVIPYAVGVKVGISLPFSSKK